MSLGPGPGSGARSDPARTIEAFLVEREGFLRVIGRAEGAWDVLVPSYWKESVACSVNLGARSLRAECFFMRAPEEGHAEVYRLLLQRNARAYLWKFTVNDEGDAGLVAEVPLDSVTDGSLDLLFGTLVTLVDETYVPYMKAGYATSLAEQVRQGGPGLDRPPPWAAEWEGVMRRGREQDGS
ncbi:MAG: YbjN domain-containing protein [Actinobacteria bacterium]|nr:YbjN domain-containing protein [Actinomycetota bacterium]